MPDPIIGATGTYGCWLCGAGPFRTMRGLNIHVGRWCPYGLWDGFESELWEELSHA